jgi:hypothetical protein
MKGFALLVGVLAGAALLYVTTAVGGPQAGPTRAEFNALKKQVATLKKDDVAIQAVLAGCLTRAAPIAEYGGYQAKAGDGAVIETSALDIVDEGDPPQLYLLDVGPACASVLNSAALNLHGLKIARTHALRH